MNSENHSSEQQLAALEAAFEENFAQKLECGASVAVYRYGEPLIELHKGWLDGALKRPWQADSVAPVFSATKGVAALSFLHLLAEHGVELTEPVARFWPELGKGALTLAQVLNHQAGLSALNEKVSIFDYAGVVRALERQSPLWQAPKTGYHARTWGFLLDELSVRIASMRLGAWWNEVLRPAFGVDIWIGHDHEALKGRMAELLVPKVTAASAQSNDALYQALGDAQSLSARSFASPSGLHAPSAMSGQQAAALACPALSGVASAAALAKFYSLSSTEQLIELLGGDFWAQLERHSVQGDDLVLLKTLRFALGLQQDPLDAEGNKVRALYGPSLRAFGHPGAGGSHGFADPDRGLGFGYVMNQMERSVLPSERVERLVEAMEPLFA